MAFPSAEIISDEKSGGATTSHTIELAALRVLLEVVPRDAQRAVYQAAATEQNVLGKGTDGARRRTYRYLRELYILSPDSVLFRALRDLWPVERQAQPLLAGLSALARDPVFRASASAITSAPPGELLRAVDLADAVGQVFPRSYSDGTLAKIGRNTFSSWEQTGHLGEAARPFKIRTCPICRPADVTYAVLLGHLQGVRGSALFDTIWTRVLDQSRSRLLELAATASQQGLLELRRAGGVIDVGFRELLRPFDTTGDPGRFL